MIKSAVFFVALFGFLLVSSQSLGSCDPFGAVPQPVIDALAQKIHDAGFASTRLKILTTFLANNTLGFTAEATTTILLQFSFTEEQVNALALMKKFILGLTGLTAAKIINAYSFSTAKLTALQNIVNYVMDLKNASSVQAILDEFAMSSDKDSANKIIAAAKPRSCLWGELTLDRFDFIVDTSGSMNTQFRTPDGATLTRLQFVQKELYRVMNGSLGVDQKFNIIRFSDSASAWQPGVVPANSVNIASASTYVQKLSAGGGTYVLNSLKLSIGDKEVKGVYLLSDGEPSDNANSVITAAVQWGKPVNTIAFKAEAAGVAFLGQLAKATGGTFRAFK